MEKTEEKSDKMIPKTKEIVETQDASLVYEVSYILLPTLDEAQVATQVVGMKSAVESVGGTLVADENPVMIDLAYQMTKVVGTIRHKCTTGYFGWMKLDMPRGEIGAVKKALDANDTVVRYLLIKTVRENTLLTGKMNVRKEEKKIDTQPDEETGEALGQEPVSLEAMDKSIDELVIA